MTDKEWLAIGYQNGIITHLHCDEVTFHASYLQWFKSRLCFVSPQTADRIEVTFNRYYAGADILEMCISKITEADLIEFVKTCCLKNNLTYKEYGRIMQICRGTLVYMRDIGRGGCPLFDWDKIKRNVPFDNTKKKGECVHVIPQTSINTLIKEVVQNKIYPLKQSACLCLCLNFYLGLRVGELASLTFEDIDLNRNVVRVCKTAVKCYARTDEGTRDGSMLYGVSPRTKTINGMREVPLLPEARYIIEHIKDHHAKCGYNSPYLAYDGGQTVLTRSLDRTLRRLVTLCDVPPFSTHDIRRNFATTLHYAGVPTRVISDLLGHGEIRTTENCYILSNDNAMAHYIQHMKNALVYCM